MTTADQLLGGSSFEGLTFCNLDLQAASLSDKELVGCTFVGCRAPESTWQRTRLEDCVFEGCDLTNMKPDGMIPRTVQFRKCKLLGVAWANLAHMPQLAFAESNLHYASFVRLDLRRTRFRDCELVEASFVEVDLTESDFSGSDLRGCLFEKCRLGKADFSEARGAFFDPSSNQVRDARVSVETAALVAVQLGMRVTGYEPVPKDAGTAPSRPGRGKRTRAARQ